MSAPSAVDASSLLRWRQALYRELDPGARHARGLSLINLAISISIVGAVILAALETEPTVAAGHEGLFDLLETIFGVCFSIEYAARLWTAAENPKYGDGWRGRLRYAATPAALFDAMAVIVSFATPTGLAPFFLRAVRLLRIIRLAKLSRMTTAMSFLISSIAARRDELLFSLFVGVFFLMLSATGLYFVEGQIQPDKFGSIPRAMWWATATLTTIGYGDVYPVTALGKVLAAISAVAGIGLVAMPTGIMAAAFSDGIQKHSEGRMAVMIRDKTEFVASLALGADDLVQQAARACVEDAAMVRYLVASYTPAEFATLMHTLDNVELKELCDFALVEKVVVLRRLVERAKRGLDKMANEARTDGRVDPRHVATFDATAGRIAAIREALRGRIDPG